MYIDIYIYIQTCIHVYCRTLSIVIKGDLKDEIHVSEELSIFGRTLLLIDKEIAASRSTRINSIRLWKLLQDIGTESIGLYSKA